MPYNNTENSHIYIVEIFEKFKFKYAVQQSYLFIIYHCFAEFKMVCIYHVIQTYLSAHRIYTIYEVIVADNYFYNYIM